MLLTRSPLSPVPKDRFSLDLHVLSAPPAFVLSQDQTLRKSVCSRRSKPYVELGAQRSVTRRSRRDLSLSAPKGREVSTFTLLSFQRPHCSGPAKKKPPTRARGPLEVGTAVVSDWVRGAPVVVGTGTFACRPLKGSRGSVAVTPTLSSGQNGVFRPGEAAPRAAPGAGPARSRARHPA